MSISSTNRMFQYWSLTKPPVTRLVVFCTLVGMFLSTTGLPNWYLLVSASLGVWLSASAAFAINCLVEREIDARMARTASRPTATGEITVLQTLLFSSLIGGAGTCILYFLVNPLTMWLTCATFTGYSLIYTIILKPATSQNIVIGGLAGAMPPALGWAATTGEVSAQAWVLVLIIFTWTPPHFWALAMYRLCEYEKSQLPMLPITYGMKFTQAQVGLYTLALVVTTVLPFGIGMSGFTYLIVALILGCIFLWHAWQVYYHYTNLAARSMFFYSIIYLSALFLMLLLDHFFQTYLSVS